MNKDILKTVENRLYDYFEREELLEGSKLKIHKLQEQIKQIDEDIRGNNVMIEGEYKSITYGEKVQTSLDTTSYFEKEFVRAVERLEKEKVFKLGRISELKSEMRKLEEASIDIECNIDKLQEIDLKFIELKYKSKARLSVEEVANELNMSRSSAYLKRDKLIIEIAGWIGLQGLDF